MSVLEFFASGGMASVAGDLPAAEQDAVKEVLESFDAKLRKSAVALKVTASRLNVRQATYLFVGRDVHNYHVVFANSPGGTQLRYRDLSAHGRVELAAVVQQIGMEIGDAVCAFSYPVDLQGAQLELHLDGMAQQYVESVLQEERKASTKISPEVVVPPEIASGFEKLKLDYPDGRVAFIMMSFTRTKAHEKIVRVLKEALGRHDIVALCADDKQYMDELFPNVKVYLHACQFGVAVFERITTEYFNPNVSLEVGYMLGMGKDVLLLKDSTLKALPTDLAGRLYREFDTQDVEATLPKEVEKWLVDKGLVEAASKKARGV